jgi:hypothetical protein
MFKGDKVVAMASMAMLVVGCSALNPKSDMAYSVDPDDPASPRDGGFAFALRATTVVIAPPASSGSTGTNDKTAPSSGTSNSNPNLIAAAPEPGLSQHSAGSHRGAGTTTKAGKEQTDKNGAGGTSPPSDKPGTNGAGGAPAAQQAPATAKTTVVRDVCKDAKGWEDCLSGVSVSTFPVSSDAPVYVVKPRPPTGAKTVLAPKVSDADPLFLTSVSFNTTSTVPTAINNAGGDAVIGLAFGPWGAAAGAVVGLFSGLYTPTANAPEPGAPPFSWTNLLCPSDTAKRFSFDKTFKQALLLPVTVDYPDVGSVSGSRCWSSLPASNPPGGLSPALHVATPTGWFYRFMPATALPPHTTRVPPVIVDGAALPSSIEPTSTYFDKPPKNWTDTRSSLPTSACRSVEFQLTYLEDMENATGQVGFKIYSTPLIVADPTFVQQIAAPSQGSITVLSVCGGYASSGGPSTAVSDSVGAFLKQIQAIRNAEKK